MSVHHSSRRVLPGYAAIAALAIACSDGGTTLPPETLETLGPPGITILSGDRLADTIEALLPQPLKIIVRDANGRAMPHSLVHFSTVRALNPPGSLLEYEEERVHLSDSSGLSISAGSSDYTASDGSLRKHIRLGRVPGPAMLSIVVHGTGAVDTARFVVTGGKVAGARVLPKDSAVVVAGRLPLRAVAIDRAGNPLPDPVSYRALDPSITVTSDGLVSGNAPTRSGVVVTSGATRPDTAWMSVVPAGTFAVRFNGSLATLSIDGGSRRTIPSTMTPLDPEWSRDGQSLLVRMRAAANPPALYRVFADGSTALLLPGAPVSNIADYIAVPIHSYAAMPDGSLIAAVGQCFVNNVLYRFGGTSPVVTRVSPVVPVGHNDCYDTFQTWPSSSPDGMRIVYQNDSSGVFHPSTVEVRDLATGSVRSVGVGSRPRWSPTADQIAFYGDGRVWVVRSDGAGLRAVSPVGQRYRPGVSWSPDGRWLMARFDRLTPRGIWPEIAILEVSTGRELPLGFTLTDSGIEYGDPVWSPRP